MADAQHPIIPEYQSKVGTTRPRPWRYPLILAVFAVVLFIAGLGYGIVMVGVPTQDATPAIASAEARDANLSLWAGLSGIGVFLIAILWFAALGTITLLRRRAVASGAGMRE